MPYKQIGGASLPIGCTSGLHKNNLRRLERHLPAILDEEAAGGSVIDTTAHQVEEGAFVHVARNFAKTGFADIHEDDLGERGAKALDDQSLRLQGWYGGCGNHERGDLLARELTCDVAEVELMACGVLVDELGIGCPLAIEDR